MYMYRQWGLPLERTTKWYVYSELHCGSTRRKGLSFKLEEPCTQNAISYYVSHKMACPTRGLSEETEIHEQTTTPQNISEITEYL
jgi:hypothetical protein